MSQRTDYCREHKYRIETGFTCTKCGHNRPSEEENRLEELRQAKAQALEEAATHLSQPYVLWHGDGGVTVKNGLDDLTRGIKLTDWLRQRAQQLKDDQ